MKPWLDDGDVQLYEGDCITVMRELAECSVDAVVCDPPYNLSFMGRAWDDLSGREDVAFGYYLAGLIDGEGHFRVGPQERRCEFTMKLRRDDRAILERVQRFVEHGRITDEPARDGSKPTARFIIDTKDGAVRLCALLTKFPLRARKARDFDVWQQAVAEWIDQPRGNRWHGPADRTRLAALSEQLRNGRAYTEIPWSGHRYQDWTREWATEAFRVLKPGGHLLAFGGTRTAHRLTAGIEDAGFEIRDTLCWLYGSGFPKSLDVSKAIDKQRDDKQDVLAVTTRLADLADAAGIGRGDVDAAMGTSDMGGWWLSRLAHRCACPSVENWTRLRDLIPGAPMLDAEVWRLNGRKGSPGEAWEQREVVGEANVPNGHAFAGPTYGGDSSSRLVDVTAPATAAAARWEGWGTALKPAYEPVILARKPLVGTVAANVLAHGTGALNIDACRIDVDPADKWAQGVTFRNSSAFPPGSPPTRGDVEARAHAAGRWPANVLLDETAAQLLDAQTGERSSGTRRAGTYGGLTGDVYAEGALIDMPAIDGTTGGPSRFFFTAKASRSERNTGLHHLPDRDGPSSDYGTKAQHPLKPPGEANVVREVKNHHPTVKPVALMRWLCRLATPPGGVILDPFIGSGSTAVAARAEGFRCIGIDQDLEYLGIAAGRLSQLSLFGGFAED